MTQAEMGQRIGVRQNTIAGYEADERQPDLATLTRMAEALDVSVDYLLGLPEAVRESTIPYSATIDLEARRGRLLHRLAEPDLSIRERQAILAQLAEVEQRIAALALAALPHHSGEAVAPRDAPAQPGNTFSLTVPDDALSGVNVQKGDVVTCRATREARSGDLVAAVSGECGDIVLRFLVREGDRWLLRPANPEYQDQPADPESGLILGVALTIEKKAPRLNS